MTVSPDDSKPNSIKGLIAKGVISAVALAGTTAIPLLVQHFLKAPASPLDSSVPATQTVTPPTTAGVTSQPQLQDSQDNHQEDGKKGQRKGKKD